MAEIIVLSDQDVAGLVSFEENMRLVEQAFADYSDGKSHVFPVVREEIAKHNGIFGIKSGYLETQEVLGFKSGGFWANNKAKGLANHQSVMVLFDPASGQPSALVAANFVTQLRTAALGAIACKYLARPDSRVLAVVGTGQQGRNQLAATLKVLPGVAEIYLYDIHRPAAEALARELADRPQRVRVAADAAEACAAADVIVTATPGRGAVVMAGWIKPGTHVNAVGTDTRGKQELDPGVFTRADKIVVDNSAQCLYLGECQHAYDAGLISKDSLHAEIGEIIRGAKSGRETAGEVTIFDTTGVAIQDLATAGYALDQARLKGAGTRISI